MDRAAARLLCLCSCLLLVAASSARGQALPKEFLQWHRRALLEEKSSLQDPVYGFLTKFEESNYSTITTNPKAYALWGWSASDKSIKYAIVGGNTPADALTATSGADIKYIHLHVNATRGQDSGQKITLSTNTTAFTATPQGFKLYALGSINDTLVANWTNELGIKTAEDLWKTWLLQGLTYTNIHTNKYPAGEARGQNDWNYDDIETLEDQLPSSLRSSDANWVLSFLTDYEETPAPAGPKTARGLAVYGWDGTTIQYAVLSGPKPTDALYNVTSPADIKGIHIHAMAVRGANSAVIIPLTAVNGTDFQTVNGLKVYAKGNLTDASLKPGNGRRLAQATPTPANTSAMVISTAQALWAQLSSGQTYTNIHTTANPGGELRGQNDWNYSGIDTLKDSAPAAAKSAAPAAGVKPWALLVLSWGLLLALM